MSLKHYKYDTNNIFFSIINKKLPSEVIEEDNQMMVIKDINPIASIHLLAIPKQNYVNYDDFITNANSDLVLHFFRKINAIMHKFNIQDNNKILSNNGFGQSIRHYHVHIISGDIKKDTSHIPQTK